MSLEEIVAVSEENFWNNHSNRIYLSDLICYRNGLEKQIRYNSETIKRSEHRQGPE